MQQAPVLPLVSQVLALPPLLRALVLPQGPRQGPKFALALAWARLQQRVQLALALRAAR